MAYEEPIDPLTGKRERHSAAMSKSMDTKSIIVPLKSLTDYRALDNLSEKDMRAYAQSLIPKNAKKNGTVKFLIKFTGHFAGDRGEYRRHEYEHAVEEYSSELRSIAEDQKIGVEARVIVSEQGEVEGYLEYVADGNTLEVVTDGVIRWSNFLEDIDDSTRIKEVEPPEVEVK